MKRTLTIAIVFISSLLLLIPASAQGPKGPRGGGGRGGIGPADGNGPGRGGGRMGFNVSGIPSRRVLERALDFTEEQFAALEVLLEEHRAATKPVHAEVRALDRQLRAALEEGTAGATEIGQIVLDKHALGGQLRDSQQTLQDSFRALLTEEQLATLGELRNRRPGRGRGPRGGGRGSGGPPDNGGNGS